MKIRTIAAGALALSLTANPMQAMAMQSMTVQEFVTTANRIPQNPTALLRADTRRLMAEFRSASRTVARRTGRRCGGRASSRHLHAGKDRLVSRSDSDPFQRHSARAAKHHCDPGDAGMDGGGLSLSVVMRRTIDPTRRSLAIFSVGALALIGGVVGLGLLSPGEGATPYAMKRLGPAVLAVLGFLVTGLEAVVFTGRSHRVDTTLPEETLGWRRHRRPRLCRRHALGQWAGSA